MPNHLLLRSAVLLLPLLGCSTVPSPPQTPPGADFMIRNAKAKRVVTTPSGLQYFVVKSGPKTGAPPRAGDTVVFDYEGKLITGETFDSSYERGQPLSGRVGDFVPGFDEALMLMRPGDEWIIWLPPELGYGDRAAGTIPPNSVLRFRMHLRSVTPSLAG